MPFHHFNLKLNRRVIEFIKNLPLLFCSTVKPFQVGYFPSRSKISIRLVLKCSKEGLNLIFAKYNINHINFINPNSTQYINSNFYLVHLDIDEINEKVQGVDFFANYAVSFLNFGKFLKTMDFISTNDLVCIESWNDTKVFENNMNLTLRGIDNLNAYRTFPHYMTMAISHFKYLIESKEIKIYYALRFSWRISAFCSKNKLSNY